MANKVSFSNQQSSLDEIEAYYSDSERALNHFFDMSVAASQFPLRFLGYSKIQLNAELKSRKEHLDRMCVLEILATLEAKFQITTYC